MTEADEYEQADHEAMAYGSSALSLPTATAALAAFIADTANAGWSAMAPFRDGSIARVCAAVDRDIATGQTIAPSPDRIFAALALTPPDVVKVVVLGQDPYPTHGHANGLAFSYVGPGPLPRSLGNIYKELAADLGVTPPRDGDLTRWAKQGVLLLNTALTVREGAGQAGSHLALGWQEVTDALLQELLAADIKRTLFLWGTSAQKKSIFGHSRLHYSITSSHPSPLSARRGFFGSRPFSRANAWLVEQGLSPVDWT
jgi:uracil-DNA glycosylase